MISGGWIEKSTGESGATTGGSRAAIEGIYTSSGKRFKTEEVDREERKIKELNKEAMFPKDNILGNTKLMRDRIITLIPLLSFAIAKKTTKP